MMSRKGRNPAEKAAGKAQDKVHACIDGGESFVLEAGAGAGKTFSLRRALEYVIEDRGRELQKSGGRVVCMTFTNVAADQFREAVDNHPAVLSGTIHDVCWSAVKRFQASLREQVVQSENFTSLLEEEGGAVGQRRVAYDLGHRAIDDDAVYLHHDDVITFTSQLLLNKKFRALFARSYPILLIDEYQDTHEELVESLLQQLESTDGDLLIGFFGDHWQQIYRHGCGAIDSDQLTRVKKGANFRSVPAVVDVLNRIRPELPQEVTDPEASGSVRVFHTNSWPGERHSGGRGGHWKGDLLESDARRARSAAMELLEGEGWDFSDVETKVLMLTHSVLAAEQGYQNLAGVFRYNESYVKMEDPHIEYLLEVVIPACDAFRQKRYGKMFEVFGRKAPTIRSHAEKEEWASEMGSLLEACANGTVGEVLETIEACNHLVLPDRIQAREKRLRAYRESTEPDLPRRLQELADLKKIDFQEVVELQRFVSGQTPFSTKHGVKGDEFDNVFVVFGRGWNVYDFNQFLELAGRDSELSTDEQRRYERNRNLFYVVCSRAKKNLALLFTQELSEAAIETLQRWFDGDSIEDLGLE